MLKCSLFLNAALLCPLRYCRAGNYTNFSVAIYIPINVVQSFDNPEKLQSDWACIHRQLKVDKVYIEVQRDERLLTDQQAEHAKTFFLDRGVQVAGGMALSDGDIGGQFQSFCYTDPRHRAFIQSAAELAARAGKSVIITSGLLRALQGKGIEDIAEIRWTDRKFLAPKYAGGFGAGTFSTLDGETNAEVMFPEIDFVTNDSWSLVRAEANGNGFPLLLLNRYSKGILYVWTMPDNFADLYSLPPAVTTAIKDYVMRGFPVRLDGPAGVALLAYNNGAFIAQIFSAAAADVKISTLGNSPRLKNLVTGETLEGKSSPSRRRNWRNETTEDRTLFSTHLLPHSYAAFSLDNTSQANAH